MLVYKESVTINLFLLPSILWTATNILHPQEKLNYLKKKSTRDIFGCIVILPGYWQVAVPLVYLFRLKIRKIKVNGEQQSEQSVCTVQS